MVIAMNRSYALMEGGAVTNLVLWDGNTATWSPPEGTQAVLIEEGDSSAQIGATYDGSKFIAPVVQPVEAPDANG